jgi:hypothetical protein
MIKRIAINLFLVFHLTAILCWALPLNSRLVTQLRPVIAPYMGWSGLAQGWNLFAPNPLGMNTHAEAEITYRDGQRYIWKFPNPQDYGYFKRYLMERDHKFSFDSMQNDTFAGIRPDAARYIARLNNNQPNNPPVTVALVGYRSLIAPPNSGSPEPWVRKVLITYTVVPGDLR